MPRLKPLTPKRVMRILEEHGRDIPKGTLLAILKQAGLDKGDVE